jgi:cytochrome P450
MGTREFAEVFDDGLRGMRKNYMTGQFSWLIGTDQKWLEKCAEIHAIVDGYIEEEIEYQKRPKELGKSSDGISDGSPYNYVLLKELVRQHSDDRLYIRNELMNVFFAARDQVGVVAGSMLFFLARNPEVWQKLRKEVIAIAPQQELSYEFLKTLEYVQAVVQESKLQ